MTKITIDTSLTAREVMQQHGLSKATAYRALARGYYTEKGKSVEDPATDKQQRSFMRVYSLNKYYDIRRGKSRLSTEEFFAFKAEILATRAVLRTFVKKPTLHTFKACIIDNKMVKQHTLVPRTLLERIRAGVQVPADEFASYTDVVQELIVQMKV